MIAVRAYAHTAGLSALLLCVSVINHSRTQRTACGVQSSGHHRRAHSEPRFLRSLWRHLAYDGVAVHYIRKEGYRNAQFLRHPGVPFTGLHIKAVPSISHAYILRHRSGEPVGYVAVALEYLVYPAVLLGILPFIPEYFGGRIGRLERIACQLEYPVLSYTTVQLYADILRSGIHPDRRGEEHLPVLVDRYRGPALSVYSHTLYLFGLYVCLCKNAPDRAAYSLPPVLGPLLRPSRMRICHIVQSGLRCQIISLSVKHRYLA